MVALAMALIGLPLVLWAGNGCQLSGIGIIGLVVILFDLAGRMVLSYFGLSPNPVRSLRSIN